MSRSKNSDKRTLPFNARSDGGDHASNEDESIHSSGFSAASSISTGMSAPQRNGATTPSSILQLEPTRESSDKNPNVRQSSKDVGLPLSRVSTADLKRSMEEKRRNSGGGRRKNSGSSSTRISSTSALNFSNNVLGIEHALESSLLSSEQSSSSWGNQSSLGIRTSFEVDDARGETRHIRRAKDTRRLGSMSSLSGLSAPLDSHLSEEQDAWAGIDELLETRSIDDSFCYSTTDILPSATVQAMRRSSKFDDETVWEDDNTEAGESTASSQYNSFRAKQVSKTNLESWNSREERERSRNDADLFRMFTWSDKDNVDEQRTRKVKLNSNALKMEMLAAQRRKLPQEPDAASLPSLATFKADDFSVISGVASLDWTAYQSNASSLRGSQPHTSDDSDIERFHDFNCHSAIFEEGFQGDAFTESSSTKGSQSKFSGDGLVLDKGVDDYIRRIQQKLPTIAEDGSSTVKKGRRKKEVGFAIDEGHTSPSPTGVIPDESPLDDLPSLAAFSSSRPSDVAKMNTEKKGRLEEKKDHKPSLTFLMNSIKKVTTKVKASKKLGDEEKYFPDAVRGGGKSRKFSANRCLLNEGDDGVNWDAD